MNCIVKSAFLIMAMVFMADNAHSSPGVGNIDDTVSVERGAVANDGRLYAWNKEGGIVPGWPKDLSAEGRHFSYGPRLADLDLDQKQEIIAVSETASGNLTMHVFKGSGAEISNWRFSIPDSEIIETPIIADINHDSSLEIVYSTAANDVHVFRRDFSPLPSFNEHMNAPPRLVSGDPDNNGLANLFAAAGSSLLAWDEYGTAAAIFNLPAGEEIIGGASIKDISRDGQSEIIFSTSAGRILAIDSVGRIYLDIRIPSGLQIVSSVVVDDIDIDKEPELIVVTSKEDVLVYKLNGEPLSSWDYKIDYREPPLVSGVVANDIYRGLFSTVTGFDQNSIYRTRHNTYSRIKLGQNIHEWDTFANFDYLEMIEVFDLFTWPKPFTPNGDGVNDVVHIHYRLSGDALVSLDLYDAHEKFISRMRDKVFERAGEHQIEWRGVDTKGTVTPNDDASLDTGLYLVKVVAESLEGFVTQATVSAIVNGVKAEIEVPYDDDETDSRYPAVYGTAVVSGIATDPNFGEDSLDADFQSYKLYYRPGVWSVSNEEVIAVGSAGSAWLPLLVPLRHQCPNDTFKEGADAPYPNSNVSCRPVQHGVLGSLNTAGLTNGEYTLLLKVMDSNGNSVGKVNYDTCVVTVANPVASDPFDPSNPFDPGNPANPKYLGPLLAGVSLSNASITRQNPSTIIRYRLENETSNMHITIFAMAGASFGASVATYSFNHQAPNDPGNPEYSFTWNGTNSLGRNVSGGTYGIKIEADATDGTGHAENSSLRLAVARGFSASDVLDVADDPVTGREIFSATPLHFNPLAFGFDGRPERTHITYTLSKPARVTLTILENVEGEGLVQRKTISLDRIRERDDGTEFWDGTGDSGLVLPVGRDYLLRLTAVGIDVGNEESITRDLAVHLDTTERDASVIADITQLRGDDGVAINDDAPLTAMVGSPDFLWRATGTGYVEMPFSYTISARGMERFEVPDYPISRTQKLYYCKVLCAIAGDPCEMVGWDEFVDSHPQSNVTRNVTVSVPSSYNISHFDVLASGAAARVYNDNFIGIHDSFALAAGQSRSYDPPWPASLRSSQSVTFSAVGGYSPDTDKDTGIACEPGGGGTVACADGREWGCTFLNVHEGGTLTVTGIGGGASGERSWGPFPVSGSSSITSTGSNPSLNFDSYDGQVGTGAADVEDSWITSYALSVSNTVNGNGSTGSSDGSTIDLPGIRAWLSGGNISAQVPFTTYSTASHDPYLTSAPYRKVWGSYQNFNQEYYRRSTNRIRIYNDGYRPNILSGNPGTHLYSFSDVVHLTNWNVDVRYPNISVTKPDGDNALDAGSGHLDVFAIEEMHVTPAGIRGAQSSNIEDYFKLRLKPVAVPRTFVEIHGSAGANYELYYYDAEEDTPRWHAIEPRTHNPVTNDILAHWDVTKLNGENYTVVLKTTNGPRANSDTFDIGIGTRVDTSALRDDEVVRVYAPFKRASLIFSRDSVVDGPKLVTINAVRPDEADFRLPTGVTPLGPIFDIKPDGIEINPDHHVQFEITYTPAELGEAFGVADASELTIYNLSGDEVIEGLATIVTFDDMDDDDPTNDIWRFTASLEHFSQYLLARKISGYFHIDTPRSDEYLHGKVAITGRVESTPRVREGGEGTEGLANLTSIEIACHPQGSPSEKIIIYSTSSPAATTAMSVINTEWDVSSLNGNYVLVFSAAGPGGADARHEISVAIDNTGANSTLLVNGQAVSDGASIKAAPGAVLEIKASDNASEAWESGVASIEFKIDAGPFENYTQPVNLWLSNGAHTIVYHSVDNEGNVEEDKSATVMIEEKMSAADSAAVSLHLSISGPNYSNGGQTWVGRGALAQITNDGAPVADIKYRFADSEYQIYDGPVQINEASEGLYMFEYFAISNLGLRGEIHTYPLLFDLTPPTTSVNVLGIYKETADGLTIAPPTQISLESSDGGESPSGLARIEFKLNDGPWNVYRDPLSFVADTVIEYRAVDFVGNFESIHSLNLHIDNEAPSVSIVNMPTVISPNGDGRFDAAEFTIDVSDDLYQDNYLRIRLRNEDFEYIIFDDLKLKKGRNNIIWDGKIGGINIEEGIYACSIIVKDEGGNETTSLAGELVYDVTPPIVAVTNGTVRSFSPNGDSLQDILQVSYTVEDVLFRENISVSLKILSMGEFEIAKSEDVVNSPPAAHVISWNGTNAMANGAFDGRYAFAVIAEDPAGNRSAPVAGDGVSSGEVFVDRYPPLTTLSATGHTHYDSSGKLWLGRDGAISLVAVDPVPASGIGMMTYSFGSSVPNVYTMPFSLPAEGVNYEVHYSAMDLVGNNEEDHIKHVRLDNTPPRTTLDLGEPKESEDVGRLFISPMTRIVLTSEDGDGVGVGRIYTELENALAASVYLEEMTLEGLGDGLHKIKYWAEDLVSNSEAKKTVEVYLDGTAPRTELSIGDPKFLDEANAVIYVTPSTPIAFKVSTDRDDFASTEYNINDESWQPAVEFNIPQEGRYLVSFRSRDRLGNIEETRHATLVVDNTPPDADISLDSRKNGGSYITPLTVVSLEGSDKASGSSVIEYAIDGGNFAEYKGPFSLNNLAPGNHTIWYRVRDMLGNVSEDEVFAFKFIDVTVKREVNAFPRVLAFMLQTRDLRENDQKSNEALVRRLADLGGYVRLITGDHNDPATVETFLSELRSDKYNIVLFATDAFAVNFYDSEKISSLLKEIKARIYKGDVFISMVGYSDVTGDVWLDFMSGLSPVAEIPDFFPDVDDKLILRGHGKGFFADFGADLGRIAESSGMDSETIATGLIELMQQVMPREEENNVGEVSAYTLVFENKGDSAVTLDIKEQLPQGWIETAAMSGEAAVIGRQYEIEVAPQSSKYVDYLFRSGVEAGTYDIVTLIDASWGNSLAARHEFSVPYAVSSDLPGLCNILVGQDGLIPAGALPYIEQNLKMFCRRVALGSEINNDEDIDELMALLLDSIDKLNKDFDPDRDAIKVVLGEMVENLGAVQALKNLGFNFSVNLGDPSDPASYHGDTTSSLGNAGGGCAIMAGNGGSACVFFLCVFNIIALVFVKKVITPLGGVRDWLN